jgi:ribosomal protein L2
LVGAFGNAFGEVLEVEVVALGGGELVVVAGAFAEVLADAVAEFEVAFLAGARGECV